MALGEFFFVAPGVMNHLHARAPLFSPVRRVWVRDRASIGFYPQRIDGAWPHSRVLIGRLISDIFLLC